MSQILYPEYTNKHFNIVIANKKEFKDHSHLDYNKHLQSQDKNERKTIYEICK